MANCSWEFLVIWNRDPESVYPLEQAIAYLKCVQNAVLQHGLATMIWQMFIVKRLSATALLIEKVGKAPKDRLCRKEVGLSEVSLIKFFDQAINLLDVIVQASLDSHEPPIIGIEDLWQSVQGPTSLVELAVEQKEANIDLVIHHHSLCVVLLASLTFSMKSIKPLSLFGKKGSSAFFKPLHSLPLLSDRNEDDTVMNLRKQFLKRVISHAVVLLGVNSVPTSTPPVTSSSPLVLPHLSQQPAPDGFVYPMASVTTAQLRAYSRWPPLMSKLAVRLDVSVDELRIHQVMELYNGGMDRLAEEILPSISDRLTLGAEMLNMVAHRLAFIVFVWDGPRSRDRLACCSPHQSSWFEKLDVKDVRCPNVPLSLTTIMVRNVVPLMTEGSHDYKKTLDLCDLAARLATYTGYKE